MPRMLLFWCSAMVLFILSSACGGQPRRSLVLNSSASANLHSFVFDSLSFKVTSKDGIGISNVPFYYLINYPPAAITGKSEAKSFEPGAPFAFGDARSEGRLLGVTQQDGSLTLKDVKFSLQNSADPYKVIDFFSTGTLTLCENTRQNNRITLELWDFRAINRDKHPCDLVVEQDDSQRDLSLTCVSDRIYKDIELARDQLRQSCEILP